MKELHDHVCRDCGHDLPKFGPCTACGAVRPGERAEPTSKPTSWVRWALSHSPIGLARGERRTVELPRDVHFCGTDFLNTGDASRWLHVVELRINGVAQPPPEGRAYPIEMKDRWPIAWKLDVSVPPSHIEIDVENQGEIAVAFCCTWMGLAANRFGEPVEQGK